MPVTASQIFDFLEQQETCVVERYEIASAAFGTLRRSLRQIILKLRNTDDQEALEISDRLRTLLSEWLTVPVFFDHSMLNVMADLFGSVEGVHTRWGSDIGTLYATALRVAEDLPSSDNPIRDNLRAIILELGSRGKTFKVYCHRRARPHFESILVPHEDSPLSESTFLHSVRDYRETKPFDVLIKVGPLRARGWGSAPDALLSAPRFGTLMQFVWSGCGDEPDFGYDPASLPAGSLADVGAAPVPASSSGFAPMNWTTRVTRFGEDPGSVDGYDVEVDELRVFREMDQQRDMRPATLVQIDGEHGIFFRPHSQVLSFDPDPAAREPIGHRIPGETLVEGMFLIRYNLDDVDLGGVRAEHGHYSHTWKNCLELEKRTDTVGLISRLRKSGLNLVHLRSAIRHWCEPPTSVIHAPQQMKHFEILIRVLGLGSEEAALSGKGSVPWWRLAWAEIRRSRGEAIQTGVQEKEIIEEQMVDVLKDLLQQIREKAAMNVSFHIPLPVHSDMKGELLLFRISAIDLGFRVPEVELTVISGLDSIDQWRD